MNSVSEHQKSQQQHLGSRVVKGFHQKANLRNIVALVIFGMIIVVFVFSGVLSGPGHHNLGAGVAATVDGEIISLKQFQEQQNRVTAYYSQMLGSQFEQLFQKRQLVAETMNQLVNNSVAVQAAEKEHIYASQENLRNMILDLPYFKKDGQFQSDVYKGILAANNMTPADFEKNLAQDIVLQKARDLFESASLVTNLEKNAEASIQNTKINVSYIDLKPELFAAQITDKQVEEALAQADFKSSVQASYEMKKAEYEKSKTSEAAALKSIAKTQLAEKKVSEVAKEIEAKLANVKTAAGLSEIAKEFKVPVKDTGLVSITLDTLPGVNSTTVMKEALNLTLDKPVHEKIIQDSNNKYIIALKEAVQGAATAKADNTSTEFMARQKSYLQFQKWVNEQKKKYDIVINQQLLSQE